MNKKSFSATVALIVLIAFCGVAAAQTTTSETNNSQPSNSPGLAAGLISVTGLSNAGNVGSAIGGFALGGGGVAGLDVKRYALTGETGAAGAPGSTPWNVWGAYSHSDIAYNFTPLQSSGDVNVLLAGVDYAVASNVIVGVAAAADHTSVALNFSGGSLSGNGTTLSPYFGFAINKNLALDGTIGYGRTNINTFANGASGSTHSDRNVGSLGLTYREVIDAWTLTGRGAFLTVHDKLGAYTLSNGTFVPDGTVNVSQIRLTGQVAYTAGAFTPFASVTYINDINRPDQAPVNGIAAANARNAWTPAIGVRFRADNSVYGSIQFSSEQRSEVKNDQFMVNLGIRF